MKRFIKDFLHRGSVAAGIGPIVLAIVYIILHRSSAIDVLSIGQVVAGIFSLTALAFLAGGLNALYQLERLPLLLAILIHGAVLYVGYLVTYLVNDWLDSGLIPMIIFSGVFVVGYAIIWVIIYSIIRRTTAKINRVIEEKRKI